MEKTLKPVEFRKKYIEAISAGLTRYFEENIFKPIFAILKSPVPVFNNKSSLLEAIQSGKVYYEYGAFRSKYNYSNAVALELEKMGAKFKDNAYFIAETSIPIQYKSALDIIKAKEAAKLAAVNKFLISLGDNLKTLTVDEFINKAVEEGFKQLQIDIVRSAVEKKAPVIELGIVNPKANLSKPDAKALDDYWKKTDKEIKELKDKIKKLKDKKKKNKKKGKGKGKETNTGNTPPVGDNTPKGGATDSNTDDNTPKDNNNNTSVDDELSNLETDLKNLEDNKYTNAPDIDINLPDLDEQSKKIAQDYTYNMKYWVKNWEAKNIVKMRQDVLKMVQEGARPETIQKYFEKRWKIAKNKAKFLAENESNLAASVIKATRYQQMGCTHFKWGRSSSREKRKLHEEYYGKTFAFDKPPVIDEKLNINGLPRQIWNCKCHMSPVINPINIMKVTNAKRNLFEKIKYAIKNSQQRNNNPWRYRRFGQGQEI